MSIPFKPLSKGKIRNDDKKISDEKIEIVIRINQIYTISVVGDIQDFAVSRASLRQLRMQASKEFLRK